MTIHRDLTVDLYKSAGRAGGQWATRRACNVRTRRESSLPYADDSDAVTIASVSCKVFDNDDEYGDVYNDDDMYNSVTGSILSTPTNNWRPPPPIMLPEPPRSHYNGWQNGLREGSHLFISLQSLFSRKEFLFFQSLWAVVSCNFRRLSD